MIVTLAASLASSAVFMSILIHAIRLERSTDGAAQPDALQTT